MVNAPNGKPVVCILCGPGHDLWPIQRPPKALLPVANAPLLEGLLKWTEEAGLVEVLVLAPAEQSAALSHFLRSRKQKESKSGLKIELATFDAEEVNGTAKVIAWAAAENHLKGDFVVLPCDLAIHASASNTSNALAALVQGFRTRDDLVSALYFERKPSEKGKEPETQFLTTYEPKKHILVDMKALGDFEEDEVPLRSSLFSSYPSARLATNLLPAHVYVCSARVLDILAAVDRFDSFKIDLIPFLAKAQWQTGLLPAYTESTALTEVQHPQALALSYSSTTPVPEKRVQGLSQGGPSKPMRPGLRTARSSVYGTLLKSSFSSNDVRPSDASPRAPTSAAYWPRSNAVTIHIWRPADGILTRVTNVASYAELNRIALKAVAQPEGIVGQHVVLGEKTSVKRCAIGDNVSVGNGSRLAGCVVMDGCAIGEGAKLDGCIVGPGARIGDHATLANCEIGEGVIVDANVQLKGEKLSNE